jgi:recombinase
MHRDAGRGQTYEIWVQDLTDRNLFCNRIMGLKLPESDLQSRPATVIKIMYDREGSRVLPPGYCWEADDHIGIDREVAEVVRLIFELRRGGVSIEKIAKKLDGTPNSDKGVIWHPSNIRQVLDNEETYRSGLLKSDSSLRLPPILQ